MTFEKPLLATLSLAISLSTSTAILVPEPANAFDFKKVTNKIKKNNRKLKNKVKRAIGKPSTKKLLQGAGAALIIGGIAKDSPAAAIIGVALVAAPELIKKDIARSYKNDLNWSGCTRCTKSKPKIVSVPGRTVDQKQQTESINRVKEDVKDIQRALTKLGLYKKGIDGDFGPGSRAGAKEFQRSLGAQETGVLTAEERHRLFIQAEQNGYVRQAVLNSIDEGRRKKVSTLPVAAASTAGISSAALATTLTPDTEKPIEEFLLAKSQFESFNNQYLGSGTQSLVARATLLPNGQIELTVRDSSGASSKTVTGFIDNIKLNPHKLSDQWIRIVFENGELSDPIVLNTRDDFPSSEAASNWMAQAYGKIDILSKLTEVKLKKPETRIASADSNQPVKPGQSEYDTNQKNAEGTSPSQIDSDTKQYRSGADGKIVLADNTPTITENGTALANPVEGKAGLKPIKVSLQSEGDLGNTLVGFDPQEGADVCQQNIYISFSFPDGENPVSHYNIVPPEGTIMIDNGDSTAYFTGSCIQGNYGFSYVYIEEAAEQKDWKHFKREGSFQIASNNEQCAIDLNTPEQSAQLQCF